MQERISKTQKVIDHLEKYGSITPLDAIYKYNATRLSGIIYVLKHKRGMNIVTQEMPFVDCDGYKSSYAKYILIKNEKGD